MALCVSGLALGWSAGLAPMQPVLPALSRVSRPAMLDLGTTSQWIADAASGLDPVLMPDVSDASSAVAGAAADDGGWFDL